MDPELDAASGIRRIAVGLLRDLGVARRKQLDGADEEALHDYRVVLRRTRTVVRALRPILTSADAPKLERLLRRIAQGTNGARDLEVLARRLEATPADPIVLDVLRAEVRRRGRRFSGDLRSVLKVRTHAQLVGLFESVFGADGYLSGGDQPYASVARAQMLPWVQRAIADTREVGDTAELGPMHEIRISFKRVRYLLEAFSDALPTIPRPLLRTLSRLQDGLGLVHDLDVFAQWTAQAALRTERRRLADLSEKLEILDASAVHAFVSCIRPEEALMRGVGALTAWVGERRDEAAARAVRDLRARGQRVLGTIEGWLIVSREGATEPVGPLPPARTAPESRLEASPRSAAAPRRARRREGPTRVVA